MGIKGMGHDVFISHSATDKEIANRIADILEGGGIQCWVAPRDIRPGDTWGGSILKAIQSSKLMVIIFSTKSNESQQVMREVELAVQKNVVVLPFRVEDIEPSNDMKYFLSATHWLDALSADLDNHLEHLLESTRSILGKGKDADSQDAPFYQEVESQDIPEHKEEVVEAKANKVTENETAHSAAKTVTPSRGSGRRTEPRLEPSLGFGRAPDLPDPVDTSSSTNEDLSDESPVNEFPQKGKTQTKLLEEADLDEAGDVVDSPAGKQPKELSSVLDTTNSSEVISSEVVGGDVDEPIGKPVRETPKSTSSNPLFIVFGALALCAIGLGVWYYLTPASEPMATVVDDPSDKIALEQPAKGDERTFEAETKSEVDTFSSLSQSAKQGLTENPKNEPSSEPYKDAPVVITQRADSKPPLQGLDKSSTLEEQPSKKRDTSGPTESIETTADSNEPILNVVSKEQLEVEATAEPDQIASPDTEVEISDVASSEAIEITQSDAELQVSKPLFDSNDLAAELEKETQELEKIAAMKSGEVVESVSEPSAPASKGPAEPDELLEGLNAESKTAEPKQKLASDMSLDELRLAAEEGDSLAQHLLGVRYEKGKGVTQSDLDAVKWYKMSAAQGNADSQHSLGIMYELGVGVSQNEEEAEKWYRLASAQGNSEAQRYLSEMLERQGR